MTTVTSDFREIEKLVSQLETFKKKALPFAARDSLNKQASAGKQIWQGEIQHRFITRNQFTVRSIRKVNVKGGGFDIDRMESQVGSVAPYMRLQEFGGTQSGAGRSHPIPTSVAAGQAEGTRPRTKAVRRPMRQPNIRLTRKRSKGRTRAQRNAMAVSRAARSSGRNRFVLLELQRGKAIAKVTGRKRIRVRIIWDLSRTSVRVPASPTLQPALKALEPIAVSIHRASIIKQLRRHHVLGY